jgi:hypothetical protein
VSKNQITDHTCAVEPGHVYVTSVGSRVQIDHVDWTTGAPRAIVKQLPRLATCPHAALRALGGSCVICGPDRGGTISPHPFESALTFYDGAWRMIAAYRLEV